MRIEKVLTDIFDTYAIRMFDDDKEFRIFFSNNLDLYWCLYGNMSDSKEIEFIIDKEFYDVYSLFLELFFNIENCIIYEGCEVNKESDAYKLLYDNGNIRWISDFCIRDNCYNEVIIRKEDERFILKFIFKDIFNRSIRFRNSRSRYDPFNICFMNMYNKLQEFDYNCYQIHMEEYLYKKKILKK